MQTIKLRDEYIKLGQALKAAGLVESGVDAKFVVQDGLVAVHELEEIKIGDIVEFDGETIKIEA